MISAQITNSSPQGSPGVEQLTSNKTLSSISERATHCPIQSVSLIQSRLFVFLTEACGLSVVFVSQFLSRVKTMNKNGQSGIYYPGVRDRDLAVIIDLGRAEKRANLNFQLPPSTEG